MADDPNTNYKTGDNEYNIFRKILARLNLGIATSGGGGGGGGGGAVTINDGTASGGAAVAQADTPLINTTLALVVRTVSTQGVVIADNADTTQGAKGDAAATDSTSSWTVISLLKGLWVKLAAIATSVATSATNSANLDVALSTRLKPADTLAAVTTVGTVTTVSTLTSGNVGGFTTVIKDTTAVSTSPAYTAGDAVGAKRTIANAVRANGTGILQSVAILDRANQKAAMTLFIFDADPTNATITDNAAFVFSTDDLKVIAQVSIGAGDYITTNSKAYAQIAGLNIPLKAASGTSLFAALVTTGTPTYAATTDVQVEYGILQD